MQSCKSRLNKRAMDTPKMKLHQNKSGGKKGKGTEVGSSKVELMFQEEGFPVQEAFSGGKEGEFKCVTMPTLRFSGTRDLGLKEIP